MKARYLFVAGFIWFAIPGRFGSLYYQAFGFTPLQVGFVLSFSTFISALTGSYFGTLSDTVASRPRFINKISLISLVFFLIHIAAVPSFGPVPAAWRFTFMLVFCPLMRLFFDSIFPTLNAVTVAQLRERLGEDGHKQFSHERLFGAFSWATISLLFGIAIDVSPIGMWIVYPLRAVACIAFVLVVSRFERDEEVAKAEAAANAPLTDRSGSAPSYDAISQSDAVSTAESPDQISENTVTEGAEAQAGEAASPPAEATNESPAFTTVVRHLLANGGMHSLLCLNLLFVMSIGMSIVTSLLFLYFANELEASNTLCGLSVVMTVVFEVPIFMMMPKLLQRYRSERMIVLGALAYVVRAAGYAVAPNAWFVLLLEPLHGVTFSMVTTGSVSYVTERTPAGMEGSAQTLIYTIRRAGRLIGEGLGGVVIHKYGSRVLYAGMSAIVAVAVGMLMVYERVRPLPKIGSEEQGQSVDEDEAHTAERSVAAN